jgi:hypothetical protein
MRRLVYRSQTVRSLVVVIVRRPHREGTLAVSELRGLANPAITAFVDLGGELADESCLQE